MIVSDRDILSASILIVDDQESNVNLLDQLLSDAGYTNVASTMKPQEVCALHRKNNYDLILLDRRFTNEPVALVLARGDEDFRLAVDQKLSQFIQSDTFRSLYTRWFGDFDQSTARFFRDTVLPD